MNHSDTKTDSFYAFLFSNLNICLDSNIYLKLELFTNSCDDNFYFKNYCPKPKTKNIGKKNSGLLKKHLSSSNHPEGLLMEAFLMGIAHAMKHQALIKK